MNDSFKKHRTLLSALLVALTTCTGLAAAADFTWVGGLDSSSFGVHASQSTNSGIVYRNNFTNAFVPWPQLQFPGETDRVIFNDDAVAGGSGQPGIGDLRNHGTLDVRDRIYLNGSTIDNRGEIKLAGSNSGSFQINSDMSLTGGGTIRGFASGTDSIISGSGILTVESGSTIRGFGTLNADIRNKGHIIAEGEALSLNQSVIDNDDALITIASGALLRLNASGNSGEGSTAIRYGRIHGEVGSQLGGSSYNASIDDTWLTGTHQIVDRMLFRGTISNDSSLRLVTPGSNAGGLLLDGDTTFDGSGEIVLGANGNLNTSISGSLDIRLINARSHTIRGHGDVEVQLENHGTLAPGLGIGTLSMIDGTTFTNHVDGVVSLDIGGLNQGTEHDHLSVDDANLSGVLEVSLANGFTPALSDTFSIMQANELVGSFDRLLAPELPETERWRLNYLRGSTSYVELSVVAFLAGDFNGDGTVDTADYTLWRSTEGLTGDGLFADGNGDQVVDDRDYNLWRSNYGNTIGSGGASSSATVPAQVPEPSSIVLVSLLLGLAFTQRRTRR